MVRKGLEIRQIPAARDGKISKPCNGLIIKEQERRYERIKRGKNMAGRGISSNFATSKPTGKTKPIMKRFILMALLTAVTVSISVQCSSSHAADTNQGDTYAYLTTEAAPVAQVERNMRINKAFGAVSVRVGVKVYYTVGRGNTVKITGPEDQVNRTVVTVEGNTLRIYMQQENWRHNRNDNMYVKVYVTAPAFNEAHVSVGGVLKMMTPLTTGGDFEVSGSAGGIFNCEEGLTCEALSVDISSGCIVTISDVEAETADLNASSGSIVTVKGSVKTLDADFSSGAIANIRSLKAKTGKLSASSGAIVNASRGSYSVHSSSGAVLRLE